MGISKLRCYSLAYDWLLPDTSASILMSCIHHWFIGEEHNYQALGICRKCGRHKTFSPQFSGSPRNQATNRKKYKT